MRCAQCLNFLHASAVKLLCSTLKKYYLLQAKNEADTAIYSTEKSLNEYKAKLPQAVVDEINKVRQRSLHQRALERDGLMTLSEMV